ncbi:hypothetical protein [Blastococcus tunisiensis]|uniref:Uncharacterized protein n=1 Tax=Blastococcus tunisiensis TaxID=1798228 RepID=A0A1I2BFE2_9ACTN|nr:hypothetical protein [Blastococcus sp. DSM 46838]SFE54013.1 hypothetical protein SAMN05216574_104125 [Blastococcus sp. DSM 46838]
MRRTRRMAAGAALAIGLGLTGCGETEQITNDDAGVTVEEFESEDPVDGGEEDADTVDKGTGGIDDDDNTGGEEDTPANDDADIDDETGTDG